jgi:hypothetical protein
MEVTGGFFSRPAKPRVATVVAKPMVAPRGPMPKKYERPYSKSKWLLKYEADIGRRIGGRVVLGIASGRSSNGDLQFSCRCDCGRVQNVRVREFRAGKALRCKHCAGLARCERARAVANG